MVPVMTDIPRKKRNRSDSLSGQSNKHVKQEPEITHDIKYHEVIRDASTSYYLTPHSNMEEINTIRMTLREYGFDQVAPNQQYPSIYVDSCYYQATRYTNH